ncbi:hypothetical protein F8154_04845 [Alkaliphilus pronyensis]|uniref:dUTPase n=1 Tax=Alkaliphilus pronyensis TaxID=1482732 RepID=A0A6I0FE68_9FIRM|nr:dUTP diphosphatase [Alkaliphilus pronyensis]KAB3536090.1 hypothetical protein F8154_04845 [Alkaliphilus pronyensis]
MELNMELNQLFKIQEIIESNIKNSTNIPEDLLGEENIFDLKFLALQVKLGQLANTTKCYKYHKNNSYRIPKEKLVLRYIDVMKFLLSIGNEHNFNIINKEVIDSVEQPEGVIKAFSQIFSDIIRLKSEILAGTYINSLNIYIELFAKYISLGNNLGLTFEEVYDYYLKYHSC